MTRICLKKISVGIILFQFMHLNAQKLEFTPFLGYTFGSNFNIDGGRARISDGTTFGASLEFKVSENKGIDFTYTRQIANVYATSIFFSQDVNQPATINYYLLGGTNYFDLKSPNLHPFFGAKIGVVAINPRNISFPNIAKFAANFNGGFKYKISDAIDFKTTFNLSFPVVNGGVNLWWSSGNGTSVGYSGTIPLVQFNTFFGIELKL